MKRRAFLTGLGAVLATPLGVGAQQAGKVHRVVFLAVLAVPDLVDALRQGLRELGWTEGQNYVLEVRSAIAEKIPGLAAELARTNPDVIVVAATAMPYLGQATANVPVVFGIGDAPVHAGYETVATCRAIVAGASPPTRRTPGVSQQGDAIDHSIVHRFYDSCRSG